MDCKLIPFENDTIFIEIIPEHGKDAYIKLVMDEWKKPKY